MTAMMKLNGRTSLEAGGREIFRAPSLALLGVVKKDFLRVQRLASGSTPGQNDWRKSWRTTLKSGCDAFASLASLLVTRPCLGRTRR